MAEMHSLIQIFFFVCVCVCWSMACEYRCLQKAEEGIRFLGAGVTVVSHQCKCCGQNSDVYVYVYNTKAKDCGECIYNTYIIY